MVVRQASLGPGEPLDADFDRSNRIVGLVVELLRREGISGIAEKAARGEG